MSLLNVEGRHKAVQDAARRFEIEHLTNPDARQIGMSSARLAQEMLARILKDDPELTRGLTALADARDAFIRAMIYARNGRPESLEESGSGSDSITVTNSGD